MRILVTGADGLLGSNVVRMLVEEKHQVVAFVHHIRHAHETLVGVVMERVLGDLLIENDVIEAAKGCDVIIHIAASTSVWPSRSEIVNKVNIDGTKNVIEACKKNHIKRLICVGSASSFGFGSKENPGVETNPYESGKYGVDYMDSKYKAMQLVLEEAKKGLPALVVCPTFMFGAYDSIPSSGAMIVAVYKGKVPGYSSGGKNYIFVKDVARAIVNALSMGRIGEAYILGHENLSYKEAFEKIAKTIGVKAPSFASPDFIIKAFGLFSEWWANISGKRPSVSYPLARLACENHYFSSAKAIKELQLPQTPIEVGIKEAFDWLKGNGYLDKK
jgi:dihydroflavonol-4-reductase